MLDTWVCHCWLRPMGRLVPCRRLFPSLALSCCLWGVLSPFWRERALLEDRHFVWLYTWRDCSYEIPLLIAPLLGIAFSMTSLPLPKAVSNYLDLMAAAVAPAALFAMGLSLVGHELVGKVGEVIWLAALKTVISPILTFALVANIFLMEPLWSQAAVILSAMPAATNTYIIAQQYNVYSKTVSPAVVVSTGMSVVTISFLLIWFGVG